MKVTNYTKSVEKYVEEDWRFHNYLIEIGGDELLSSILETYSIITFSYLGGFRGGLVRPPQETLPEHLAMIEAIARKEPEKAEQAARLHLRRSREKLKKDVEAEEHGNSQQDRGQAKDQGVLRRR